MLFISQVVNETVLKQCLYGINLQEFYQVTQMVVFFLFWNRKLQSLLKCICSENIQKGQLAQVYEFSVTGLCLGQHKCMSSVLLVHVWDNTSV